MRRTRSGLQLVGGLLILGGVLGLGCSKVEPPRALSFTGVIEYVEAPVNPVRPQIRYADGLVSVNDRCPVKRSKLNRKMTPIYANGRPVGFC